MKIALLASGNGSVLESLLEAGYSVELIVTNNTNAPVREKAQKLEIACEVVNEKRYPNGVDAKLLELLEVYGIDWIVLAGYMKRLSPLVISKYRRRIVNSHPSLLPKYGGKGMYGRRVHEAVIASGEDVSGVSVHFVDEEYDSGEIILQKVVPIKPHWDAASLEEEVKKVEKSALVEALGYCLSDR